MLHGNFLIHGHTRRTLHRGAQAFSEVELCVFRRERKLSFVANLWMFELRLNRPSSVQFSGAMASTAKDAQDLFSAMRSAYSKTPTRLKVYFNFKLNLFVLFFFPSRVGLMFTLQLDRWCFFFLLWYFKIVFDRSDRGPSVFLEFWRFYICSELSHFTSHLGNPTLKLQLVQKK